MTDSGMVIWGANRICWIKPNGNRVGLSAWLEALEIFKNSLIEFCSLPVWPFILKRIKND